MRSIVRRDTGESYPEYLKRLAEASGVENPSASELARLDRKRSEKKTSNKDWQSPNDPDARITKTKKGPVRLAHKTEHAVDMDTGAVVAVTVQPADRGDPESVEETLEEAGESLGSVLDDEQAREALSDELLLEIVADKGYHSNAVMKAQRADKIRTYIAEPDRGRRKWKRKKEEQAAVYANRRRIRGLRGRRLQRLRGERVERSFAHAYESGKMRRTYLHGHENIRKRLLIHLSALNLGLVLRKHFGAGTPRALRELFSFIYVWFSTLSRPWRPLSLPQAMILAT